MRTLLFLLILTAPAAAEHPSLGAMVCGRYVVLSRTPQGKPAERGIFYDIRAPREILLNKLDASIHAPDFGRCVCAHGKLKGETFVTLTKMELIEESFCKANGL